MKNTTLEKTLRHVLANLRNNLPLNNGIPTNEWEHLLDRYSHFSDSTNSSGFLTKSEILITSLETPRPCLHLMCSNHQNEFGTWGSFWDQFGGGFSCIDSVLGGRMTSHLDTNYVPTSPEPQDYRGFYIHEKGHSWSMFPAPGFRENEYSGFSCTQGLDYQILRAGCNELDCELTVFVHPDEPVELWHIKIINSSKHPRQFSWFSKLRINIDSYPFYYFVPRVVCEGLFENSSLVFLNHDQNNKHKRNAFFTAIPSFDAYDMMAEVFDGVGNRNTIPMAVQKGSCMDSAGQQPFAGLIAGAQFCCKIRPGETKDWYLAYGKAPYSKDDRAKYLSHVRNDILETFNHHFANLHKVWDNKISTYMISTPCKELDRYFNVWSKYQGRNQARFCRALDKVGYRDILQDLLTTADCEHEYVRNILLRTLEYQMPDGTAVRQYEKFEGGGHDMRKYADSPCWIPDLLITYLKETGDFSILDVEIPFFSSQTFRPDAENIATVYEHALRAVRSLSSNIGYHGLCKIGYGDWNDALSGIGGEHGVSVWLSCACVYAAQCLQKLADFLGRTSDASEMKLLAESMTDNINNSAWDGNWYVYAINGHGEPIGSVKNQEGKIHLNVNTWALFTGIAKKGDRENVLWSSLNQLKTNMGMRLLAPAYTNMSRQQVGRIADQLPGMFENGSIYTHGEAFYLYALICQGRADEFFENLVQTLPSSLVQDISTSPRQQQSNFTVGPDHQQFGKQLFSNFTGSLPWYRKAISTMLGVLVDFDSIIIAPCVPSEWNNYTVQKAWRGRNITFNFTRSHSEAKTIRVNHQNIPNNRIPVTLLHTKESNHVDVEY